MDSEDDDEGETVERLPGNKDAGGSAKKKSGVKPVAGGEKAEGAGEEAPAAKKQKLGKKERQMFKALKAQGIDPDTAKAAVFDNAKKR